MHFGIGHQCFEIAAMAKDGPVIFWFLPGVPPYVRSPSQYQSRPQPQTEDIRSQEGCHSGSFCGFPRSEVLMGNRTTVTLLMFWLRFLKKTMSRAWAKTKPGLFTQWRLQHRSHDSGQAVRLSIYTALGSAPRRELRMKTLDMVVGGRNGVRLQDIMYPVQVTWHAMQRAKAQRWTLHKIVDQANLCTGRKIWTFAFEASFSLQKKHWIFESNACSRNAKGKKKSETTKKFNVGKWDP